MSNSVDQKREISYMVQIFIDMTDKLGFTCELPEDEGILGDICFSENDYNNWENYLKKLYLKE